MPDTLPGDSTDGLSASSPQAAAAVAAVVMFDDRSATIAALAEALSKAQGLIRNASMDANNPFFKSRYADLGSVWDACREALSANGLAVVQSPSACFVSQPAFETKETKNGDFRTVVKVITRIAVKTTLLHSSGEWISSTLETFLPTGDPQSLGSAITYLRRYSLSAVVGVAPEGEDDDGNAGSDVVGDGEVETAVPEPPKGTWAKRMKPTTGGQGESTWTRYDLYFSNGKRGATFDEGLAKAFETARAQGIAVEPTIQPGKKAGTMDVVALDLLRPGPVAVPAQAAAPVSTPAKPPAPVATAKPAAAPVAATKPAAAATKPAAAKPPAAAKSAAAPPPTKVKETAYKDVWCIVKFADGRHGATDDKALWKVVEDALQDETLLDPVLTPGQREGTFVLTALKLAPLTQPSVLDTELPKA